MRAKKCKGCGKKFIPERQFQNACSIQCSLSVARKVNEMKFKAENRTKKQQIKTKPQLTKEAQADFNKFIRLRDEGKPCISCGKTDEEINYVGVGGKWDCGHYLTVGSHPELRFDEANAHRQCKSCNGGSGRFAKKDRTVSQKYRENLILRIGEDQVKRLEGPHDMPNWTRDDLREIRKRYKIKIKQLNVS